MANQPLSLTERVSASISILKNLLKRPTAADSPYRSGLTTLLNLLEWGNLQKVDIAKYGLRMRPGGQEDLTQ